jgi:hypothetical protein
MPRREPSMIRHVYWLGVVACVGGLCALAPAIAQAPAAYEIEHRTLERTPDRFHAKRRLKRDKTLDALKRNPTPIDVSPFLVVVEDKKWKPGGTVTVAFKGGDAELHEKIAGVATEWSPHANIKFDFGRDPATGKYRSWRRSDKTYKADIRIAFRDPEGGYWSLLGTESRDPEVAPPGDASMNLEDFDKELPADWRGTVRHEFGHALGLEHEHQSPAGGCDDEYRWKDDPGYKPTRNENDEFIVDSKGRYPGLYRSLGGPPNEWTKKDVDAQMRQLTNSSAYKFGPFDKNSIMKYAFDAWMFKKGKASPCYSEGDNETLSTEDKARVAKFYGKDAPPDAGAAGAGPASAAVTASAPVDQIAKLRAQVARSPYLTRLLEFRLRQLQSP